MDSAYVLDSYALIAHLENETAGEHVTRMLRAAQDKKTKLYLSVINFGEIYYIALRERGEEKAEEARFLIEQLPIDIVHADKDITIEAAKLKGIYPVAYADCFAAALGIQKKAKVVTGDPEFKKLSDKVKVEWI